MNRTEPRRKARASERASAVSPRANLGRSAYHDWKNAFWNGDARESEFDVAFQKAEAENCDLIDLIDRLMDGYISQVVIYHQRWGRDSRYIQTRCVGSGTGRGNGAFGFFWQHAK